MVERDDDVISLVVPDGKCETLQAPILTKLKPGSTICTDGNWSYHGLERHGYVHKVIDKDRESYARMGVHVNNIEGFWRHLKAGINGTYIHVSAKHLNKYAKEFEFRFNCRDSPERMLPELLSVFPDIFDLEQH